MQFTLIRHSKTKIDPQVPITLWGLTDEGIDKAKAMSDSEVIKNLDLIYSSNQTKAIETMLYLAKPNSLPMQVHPDLTEITSFTNKFYTGQEYEDNISNFYNGSIKRINNGESISEALLRFEAALDGIVTKHPKANNIGIVTHGYIMSFFTAKYSELVAHELHKNIGMPDTAIFNWDAKNFSKLWSE